MLEKGIIPVIMADTNNYPDVSPQDEDVLTLAKESKASFVATSSFIKKHNGAQGTYIGNATVDAKFLPTLGSKVVDGQKRHYFVNSNCLDVIYFPERSLTMISSKHMTVVMNPQEDTDPVYGDEESLRKRLLATDHYVVDALLAVE